MRKKKQREMKFSYNRRGDNVKVEIRDETYRLLYRSKFNIVDENAIYDLMKAIEGMGGISINNLIKRKNKDLDRVWCELISDVNKEDIAEFEKFTRKISEIDKTKRQIYQEELYHLLMDKEKFLRILQNKQGKGVSYIDEEEDDFD